MPKPGEKFDPDSTPSLGDDAIHEVVDATIVDSNAFVVVDAEVVETDTPGDSDTERFVEAQIGRPPEITPLPSIIPPAPFEQTVACGVHQPTLDQAEIDSLQSPDATEEPEGSNANSNTTTRSWVFRCFEATGRVLSHFFGIASIIFLLAVAASIPIVQLVSFGYLLEVSGRLARKQTFRDAMIGLNKASKLGGIVLGTWLTLLPIRFISEIWYEAYLIDPSSPQTLGMRIAQVTLICLSLLHITTALTCGGKLRYFFWPVIAPFSFGIWVIRRFAGLAFFRKTLDVLIGWGSPHLVSDICNVQPISDWFVPAIFFKQIFTTGFYSRMRDSVWSFTLSLRLPYYFMLGLKGFAGSFAWLVLPTALLVTASYTEGAAAIFSGIFGVLFAIPIFMMLPFIQTHFAKTGKLRSFTEIVSVFKNFGRAPFAHISSLLISLLLALPLFFLKIEQIPSELLWTLSIVFIAFSWPARMSVGWAYRRGAKRETTTRWWLRYPVFFLAAPIALSFVMILTLTRYVSWNGALSLYENHVFLLPAPFWM